MKLLMWSGPRNLSTAMMYAFAQRSDCEVWDEPFYAAYLDITGLDHPMREETIAAGLKNPHDVIARATSPSRKPIHYQKHMTHHMLGGIPLDWIRDCTNVFLIRHPAYVIASYNSKRTGLTLDDIGFRQQIEIFEYLHSHGHSPYVIDAGTILNNPKLALSNLCNQIGIEFEPAMLSWPKGGISADGAWAPHWYGSVHASTGFSSAHTELPNVPKIYADIYKSALNIYETLKSFAQ